MDFTVAEPRWKREEVRHEADAIGKVVEEFKAIPGGHPKLLEELQRAHQQMDRALNRFKV